MSNQFYVRMDTQYDYHEGQELYHVFERGRLNEFGEPYCVCPFLFYDQARRMADDLNKRARPLPMNGTDNHQFGEE